MHEDKGYERLHCLIRPPRRKPLPAHHTGRPGDGGGAVRRPAARAAVPRARRHPAVMGRPCRSDHVGQVRGAAVHLDGARIWESAAGYGVHPAEIAALFNSADVSFDKGLGGIAGCVLVGEAAVVAQVTSGVAGTAARCSACGPTPPRRRPACVRGFRSCRAICSMPRPSQRCCGRRRGSPYCRTLRRPR